MIDKSRRKTKVEKHGNIIAIYFTSGIECLWLNMYLDTERWQMTCDSDIGTYSYLWGKPRNPSESFLSFCVKEAAKSVGVHDTKVSAVCKGNRKTTGGHSFHFLTREEVEAALKGGEG